MEGRFPSHNLQVRLVGTFSVSLILLYAAQIKLQFLSGKIFTAVKSACLEDKMKHGSLQHLNHKAVPFTTQVPQDSRRDPLVVYTEIYIEDLNSFKPVTMDFRLDFFLKHHWAVSKDVCSFHLDCKNEQEFATSSVEYTDKGLEQSIIINAKEVKYMWLPDTYIGNSKVVETPAKDSSTSFIIVKRKEQKCAIEYTLRLAAILSCQMDFKYYPVDVQVCPFNLRSFSYPRELVLYVWDQDGPPPINPEMRMLRHRVAINKGKSEIHMLNMTYSMLYVNLTFERDLAHHLIQVFTPSALIVMLSWLSFWLGLDATPGRITLCVTSLLALITQFSSIRRDLPPLSYIHRVDIWMVTCMCFVFASLLEFTVLIYMERQQRSSSRDSRDYLNMESNIKFSDFRSVPKKISQKPYEESLKRTTLFNSRSADHIHQSSRDWVQTIDKSSRFLFPLAFLVFNAFYWPVLLSR